MAAERIAHVRTKQAVYQALEKAVAVAGVSCEAFSDGVTVEAGESDYDPDALVDCGPKLDGDAIAAPNPVIIVEVLSPSISSTDTGGKLADYFSLTPVMHYLIVHATRPVIIHHRRSPLGIDTRIVAGGKITMDPPGITIDLDEIYGAGSAATVR